MAYEVTLDWVADFLRDRQQEVVLEGAHSSPTKVTSGVPQGTVLGPLLLLVYINDMPEGINSTVRLFADDSLVYTIIRSKEDQTILQEDLRKLQEWERKWQMQFNADKCEVLRISNQQSQFPQAEHPGLSTTDEGTVLQDPGSSDYGVCLVCLRPLYKYQHQEA